MFDSYSNFFLVSAGASAAFIGLLFVSLTITNVEETDQRAKTNRDALAGSAFAQLLDAFFVSMGGLAGESVSLLRSGQEWPYSASWSQASCSLKSSASATGRVAPQSERATS